jgi:hypothetical protein
MCRPRDGSIDVRGPCAVGWVGGLVGGSRRYYDAQARRARMRRGTLTAEEMEEEEKANAAASATDGAEYGVRPNTAFEATVNGTRTPVHVGLEDVFCRWDVNMRMCVGNEPACTHAHTLARSRMLLL